MPCLGKALAWHHMMAATAHDTCGHRDEGGFRRVRGSLRAPKSGSLRAPENETFGVYLGDKGRAGLGDKSGHGAGTGGWFRGQAWWIRTKESHL